MTTFVPDRTTRKSHQFFVLSILIVVLAVYFGFNKISSGVRFKNTVLVVVATMGFIEIGKIFFDKKLVQLCFDPAKQVLQFTFRSLIFGTTVKIIPFENTEIIAETRKEKLKSLHILEDRIRIFTINTLKDSLTPEVLSEICETAKTNAIALSLGIKGQPIT